MLKSACSPIRNALRNAAVVSPAIVDLLGVNSEWWYADLERSLVPFSMVLPTEEAEGAKKSGGE